MKLSNLKTKTTALVLTSALCLSGLAVTPNKAEAAGTTTTILEEMNTATANTPVQYDFTIEKTAYTYVDVFVSQPVDMNCTIKTTAGNETIYDDSVVSTDSTAWEVVNTESGPVYAYYADVDWKTPVTGNYTLSLTFGADTAYILNIYQDTPTIKMNKSTLNLTVGFSETLKVSDASSKSNVKWTSSKTSVASVNSSGKVTAKKAGSATITARDTSTGATAKCAVKVVKNVYSNNKATVSNVSYGSAALIVTKMNYDKKGNLHVKAKFVNNSGKKVVKIEKATIIIKNKSNKKIGSFKISNKPFTVLQGGTKSIDYTIKKSKLSIKKTQDLPNATPSISKDSTYITQG